MIKYLSVLLTVFTLPFTVSAQENSPYSIFGIGDLTPNHNILSRGMGGIAAGYADNFSINLTNPAALANIGLTAFDIGGDIDIRTLKSKNPVQKFSAANTLISYAAIGFPIASEKMRKKGNLLGLSFGLKPISRINYKVENNQRIAGVDSLYRIFEGTGGLSQVFIGAGARVKNFSFGFTTGYMFGNKDSSVKRSFINDTLEYYQSNSASQTRFGGVFINAGLQYEITLNKNVKDAYPKILRIGVYGNLKQKLKAKQDIVVETFGLDGNGSTFQIDSVYEQKDVRGTVELPVTLGAGFTYKNRHWLIGADFEMSNWSNYRFYGVSGNIRDNWTLRLGAEYYPAKNSTPAKKYFSFVRYRAGFYYGPDYIKLSDNRNEIGFTGGAGFPLTSLQRLSYLSSDYVVLNTGFEIANRGNQNSNLRENIVRISLGISMNARWFLKRKYD